MYRILLALTVLELVTVVWSRPGVLPEPGELALVLGEEEFEDYLDHWLEIEESKWIGRSRTDSASHTGCTIRINGDLGFPQPVYLRQGSYMQPDGATGQIRLNYGEQFLVACAKRTLKNPYLSSSVDIAIATCEHGSRVSGAGWLDGYVEFSDLSCSGHSNHVAKKTTSRCYNDNLVIRVGYNINETFLPLYWSCFDQNRLEVLYVWYDQTPENAIHETGVDRSSFAAGIFYPGVAVNNLYTKVTQKAMIATLVGDELADKYVTSTQYLARGHLAAKSDYVFASSQRATFYFINAAPQWQPFNAGNWNWLEQNARARIAAAGYRTVVYTGTFGVSQLRDQNDTLVDIYLYRDENNNLQLPVPLYFYKVIYDESRKIGTAFVSINNPYYTEDEVRALTFCTDRCRNNADFDWLNWRPDSIDLGYSFCCDVNEFRKTVPHLPDFSVDGLLF